MSKLTLAEWQALVENPASKKDEILAVSHIRRGEGGLDFSLVPNPDQVDVLSEDVEGLLDLGNGAARVRRHLAFEARQLLGAPGPIIVSEMDSWGQFPVLIDEIVDHLNEFGYLVWSVGAAGDTMRNMVNSSQVARQTEYMLALRRQPNAKAFLFSGAGNDIIGEDPDSKVPALCDLLNEFNPDRSGDVETHINMDAMRDKLGQLEAGYRKMITTVRGTYPDLPILIHGYDYVFPYPWVNDQRNPWLYAAKNQWLGKPLDDRQIPQDHLQLRRGILIYLIDRLYDMMEGLVQDPALPGVHLVNCRGAMPDLEDWADEIHGTDDGFLKVAERFHEVLRGLGISPGMA